MSMNLNSMYGGYGMMPGSMPAMQGMYGSPTAGTAGTVIEGFKQKYGCSDCFKSGPYFVQYPIPVNQVPRETVKPSFFSRIMYHLFGC